MATVTMVLTDAPGDRVTIRVESQNPSMPLDGEGNPDPDQLTGAQAVAIGALMEMSDRTGEWDWRALLVD